MTSEMSCKICGRYSCDESFHSAEAVEEFYKYEDQVDKMSKSDTLKLIKEKEHYEKRSDKLDDLVYEVKWVLNNLQFKDNDEEYLVDLRNKLNEIEKGEL